MPEAIYIEELGTFRIVWWVYVNALDFPPEFRPYCIQRLIIITPDEPAV